MKKTIRLTESELRHIISESVRDYLTELDWRTYRSAGDKAAKRSRRYAYKDDNRAWWFYRAANSALADKFDLNNETFPDEFTYLETSKGEGTDEDNYNDNGGYKD